MRVRLVITSEKDHLGTDLSERPTCMSSKKKNLHLKVRLVIPSEKDHLGTDLSERPTCRKARKIIFPCEARGALKPPAELGELEARGVLKPPE